MINLGIRRCQAEPKPVERSRTGADEVKRARSQADFSFQGNKGLRKMPAAGLGGSLFSSPSTSSSAFPVRPIPKSGRVLTGWTAGESSSGPWFSTSLRAAASMRRWLFRPRSKKTGTSTGLRLLPLRRTLSAAPSFCPFFPISAPETWKSGQEGGGRHKRGLNRPWNPVRRRRTRL
jgi:hypothetical protein